MVGWHHRFNRHEFDSIFPSIRVFSNVSVLCIRWPKCWEFQLYTPEVRCPLDLGLPVSPDGLRCLGACHSPSVPRPVIRGAGARQAGMWPPGAWWAPSNSSDAWEPMCDSAAGPERAASAVHPGAAPPRRPRALMLLKQNKVCSDMCRQGPLEAEAVLRDRFPPALWG